MRVLLTLSLALALLGCRTQPFAFGDLGETTMIIDQQYDARMLPTNLLRFVVYQKSEAGGFCAYLRIATRINDTENFTTPKGFGLERVAYRPFRDDCFTVDPFDNDDWGAEAFGSLTFTAQSTAQSTVDIPCGVNLHAKTASHLTEQNAARPADIVANVDFDVDNLSIDDACPNF